MEIMPYETANGTINNIVYDEVVKGVEDLKCMHKILLKEY